MKVLKIDCSIRTSGSKTRDLSAKFVDLVKMKIPTAEVVTLDLSINSPPHVAADFVAAYQTILDQRTDAQRRD